MLSATFSGTAMAMVPLGPTVEYALVYRSLILPIYAFSYLFISDAQLDLWSHGQDDSLYRHLDYISPGLPGGSWASGDQL